MRAAGSLADRCGREPERALAQSASTEAFAFMRDAFAALRERLGLGPRRSLSLPSKPLHTFTNFPESLFHGPARLQAPELPTPWASTPRQPE